MPTTAKSVASAAVTFAAYEVSSAVLYIYALQYCTVMTFVCVCVCVCVNTYVMDTEHCLIGCFLLLIQAVKDILSVRHGQVAEAEGVL